MEVMGLMLGEFVDDYTVHVVDVFAMPQRYSFSSFRIEHQMLTGLDSGTGVSVEAVDYVYQAKMIEMLK